SIIRSTTESVVADDNGCATTKPSQIIRPYKAVLALDSFNDAPVRAAILDVAGGSTVGAGDGVFDNKDIEAYIAAFQAAEAIGDDTDYNYGRFDLNGDVHQGGNNTRPFDLNINGDTLDSETVEVNGSGRRFVEHEMSDRAILCYYSHSFLFSGDLAALSEENRNYLFADCGELVDARIFFVTIDSSEEIIASMAPDGSNYKAETDIFEHTFALTPTVVPGTQIVAFLGEKSTGFGSSAQFTNGIFIQYRSRNSSTLVVEGAYRPSISEKLGKIYYEKSIQREGEFYWDVVLFRSNFDGSEEEQLTNSVGLNSQVSISPDGSKMVFVTLAEDYSYSTLKISDARGNGVSNIPVSGLMENPSWSPDSKKIVYDRYEGQNRNIYIYDTVTGENKALTNYSGNGPLKKAWEPTWSPDGNKIAFAGADGTNATEIYTITIDGTELTNITNTPNVKDDSPAWGS
ncbi:MAG: DPP IV N-terminal domain-containing protein, partial [Gammaproteobacteria bacterium]|nr:DPP IV N-terminal domain-containing protein [Gammaproteobacteria bacterium]